MRSAHLLGENQSLEAALGLAGAGVVGELDEGWLGVVVAQSQQGRSRLSAGIRYF